MGKKKLRIKTLFIAIQEPSNVFIFHTGEIWRLFVNFSSVEKLMENLKLPEY